MNKGSRSVSVIGLGYIGLPTAAVLASHGIMVTGVDVNPSVVDAINRGKITIVEPDLDSVVHMAVINKKLKAVRTPEPADAFIIAVPTPFKADHEPDISYIHAAAKALAPVLKKGDLVVLESTSPVGTTEMLSRWLAEERSDLYFPHEYSDDATVNIAYCPERVLPGKVLVELVENDRIIGGLTSRCAERARNLYRIFVRGECFLSDARTAEMAKLSENAFRDVNIAFANELSLICEKLDINVWELISLANRHPRVNILQPGPGVGGHCIAVDPWFIVHSAPEQARIIRTAREVNDRKPYRVIQQVKEAAAPYPAPVIACFGLAFKADIDDLRESPAMHIVHELQKESRYSLIVVEPYCKVLPPLLDAAANVRLCGAEEALVSSHIVLMLVNHRLFAEIDPSLLEGKTVIDTRGIWPKVN